MKYGFPRPYFFGRQFGCHFLAAGITAGVTLRSVLAPSGVGDPRFAKFEQAGQRCAFRFIDFLGVFHRECSSALQAARTGS
ncbi:MAG: hypothetical protein WBD57_15850 [Candidatus Cybelea sp.]